jgi:signal transduction histidine kinase
MAHIESAREEERVRIAREVHDELGQILTALKLDLEGLALKHADRTPAMRKDYTERIAGIVRTVDLTINTVRRISAELRPSILTDLGLSAALKWQLQEFESRTGVRCRCQALREDLHLDAELSLAVFRIFQEILTNVVRHAAAKSVSVALRARSGWLTLRVADDGKGLDPKRLSDPLSLGLLGMRERALQLGGHVDFAPRRRSGTVVTVRIPTGTRNES